MGDRPDVVERWQRIVSAGDLEGLRLILAPEAVFRSPAVHTPVVGHDPVWEYLRAAVVVLGPTVVYERQWWDDSSAVLEFGAVIGDAIRVHGIDMLTWDAEGRVTELTVMVRPFKAINTLIGLVGGQLKAQRREARARR